MEKRLIAILSVSLIAALLVIAFQAGRMSVKINESTPQTVAITGADKRSETVPVSAPRVDQWPASAYKEQQPLPFPGASKAELPLPGYEHADAQHGPSEADSAAAIASYFAKIDAIHVEGSGDPTTFAQGILGGIERGDPSKIDKLVDDAKVALGQANGVRPPLACAEYHRRLIEALSQSVAGLENFRNAIEKSDLDSVASVAAQLQSAQQKINTLDIMRKQLLGQ
jgi:hypothetical protein